MIRCGQCEKTFPYFKGSKFEEKFMRHIDDLHEEKRFFCSPSCYIDFHFYRAFSSKFDVTDLDPGAVALLVFEFRESQYDLIRDSVYTEPGFQDFLKRNGYDHRQVAKKEEDLREDNEGFELISPVKAGDWADE